MAQSVTKAVVANPDPVVDTEAAKRAALALSMAGRALDPNAKLGADPELAQLLLRESVLWVARAFQDAEVKGFDEAVRLLQERGIFTRALGDGKAENLLPPLEAAPPKLGDLGGAEPWAMKLVDFAGGSRRTRRHERVARWGFAALLVFSVALVFTYSVTHRWRSYPYRTSSAYTGYEQTGELGDASGRDLLFHTADEDGPWVEINLLGEKRVHSVLLQNRLDCCQERGTPLVVEVATRQMVWQTVAQRDTRFDEWRADFPPVDARYLRIRSLGHTILHLRQIQIQ